MEIISKKYETDYSLRLYNFAPKNSVLVQKTAVIPCNAPTQPAPAMHTCRHK